MELMRITTIPLTSKFIGQLDRYTDDLIKVFHARGGSAGKKISTIMAPTANLSVKQQAAEVLQVVSFPPHLFSGPFSKSSTDWQAVSHFMLQNVICEL